MPTLSPEELVRRRAAWAALSELFLDTQLDDAQLSDVAARLRASGYSPAQLEQILDTEVAPLLYSNLGPGVTVAGVWSGFDPEWLEEQILAGRHLRIQRWYALAGRWSCQRVLRSIKADIWARLRPQLGG